MASLDLLTEHAREILGVGDDWHYYSWELLPDPPQKSQFIKICGAVAPPEKDGGYDWTEKDPATDETVYITLREHKAWRKEWSRKTGRCYECGGDGQAWAGWNCKTGDKWKRCGLCGGTGKLSSVPEIAAEAKL